MVSHSNGCYGWPQQAFEASLGLVLALITVYLSN